MLKDDRTTWYIRKVSYYSAVAVTLTLRKAIKLHLKHWQSGVRQREKEFTSETLWHLLKLFNAEWVQHKSSIFKKFSLDAKFKINEEQNLIFYRIKKKQHTKWHMNSFRKNDCIFEFVNAIIHYSFCDTTSKIYLPV